MKKSQTQKGITVTDTLIVLLLIISLCFSIGGIGTGIKSSREYNNHMKNAVTVTATVEDIYTSTVKNIKHNIGAGDIGDEQITYSNFYDYKFSYNYKGKEYTQTSDDFSGQKGEQVQILIDSTDPEYIIGKDKSKGNFIMGGIGLILFLIVLVFWIIVTDRNKKHIKRKR